MPAVKMRGMAKAAPSTIETVKEGMTRTARATSLKMAPATMETVKEGMTRMALALA